MTEKPKRRWYQFSLRTLLLLVLFCGAGLGLLGRKLEKTGREVRARERAVAELNKFGAIATASLERRGWLARLLGDRSGPVTAIQLGGPAVTDDSLEHLKALTSLERVWLIDAEVSGPGLAHLQGLTNLRDLHCDSVPITDAGLEHLGNLSQLEELGLQQTRATPEGALELRGTLPECKIEHSEWIEPPQL